MAKITYTTRYCLRTARNTSSCDLAVRYSGQSILVSGR